MKPGYAYEYTGTGPWQQAPDDDWEITTFGGGRVEFLGERKVDGARVTVWQHDGGVWAQTLAMAPPPKKAVDEGTHLGLVIRVTREPLNRGGYTKAGRYFGIGAPLWRYATDDAEIDDHLRAKDKATAKAELGKKYPGAKIK